MKTALFLLSLLMLAACGSNGSHANDPSIHPAGKGSKGQQLVAGSDCLSCHQEKDPMVGPSYQAVAQRYDGKPDAVTTLAQKVIKGGSGNWGQTPMTPHPALSTEDAEEMVRYVLSVK